MRYQFPGLLAKQAEAFVKTKKLKPSFNYQDIFREEHINNFTVAKAMNLDILADLQTGVQDAISKGITFQQFQKDLKPLLQQKGWWGIKNMKDPKTGKTKQVQLGSPRRLKTIYDTNIRQARSVEVYENTMRNKHITPYFKYNLGPSKEHRVEHANWSNIVLPVDHPFWDTHFAPNGYACKCHMTAVTKYDYDKNKHKYQTTAPKTETREFVNKRTGEVMRVPKGIDPGFDYNPGKQKRQWDKYGHLPDCDGLALNATNGNPCVTKIPGQKGWKDYKRPDLRQIEKKYKLKTPDLLPRAENQKAAEIAIANALLPGNMKQRIIKAKIWDVVLARDKIPHMVEKRDNARERYANLIIPTLEDPYEIWLPKYSDGSIRPNYIAVFDGSTKKNRDLLVIIKEAKDGALVWNIIQANHRKMNAARVGELFYKKD